MRRAAKRTKTKRTKSKRIKRAGPRKKLLKKRRLMWVYKVRSRRSGKRYVVKGYRRYRDALRERRAIRACAGHPNIVRLHRFIVRRRKYYVVLKWVRGPLLSRVIRRRGPLPPLKVIDIALEVLAGVKQIHSAGFVHGDLHAGNVILTSYTKPRAVIIDFQHAVRKNQRGKARSIRRLARPPLKLAPESRRRWLDDSYDLYGVGYMCAHMLLGKPPRRRIRRVRERGKLRALWLVIHKALRRKPAARYRSAEEMIAALEAVRKELSEAGEPGSPA